MEIESLFKEFIDHKINLPDKLSDCIKVALNDEQIVFDSPLYQINMEDNYHKYNFKKNNTYCEVCFAGAVMASTLKQPATLDLFPGYFNDHNFYRLIALDYVRTGRIEDALDAIEQENDEIEVNCHVHVTNYEDNRDEWRRDMLSIANLLQSQDL